MSRFLQRIHRYSPVPLQHLLASAQGYAWTRRRYNAAFRRYLSRLMASQWFSPAEFLELQTHELRRLLRQALAQVPYYQHSLAPYRDSVERFTLADLAHLPIVTKDELRRHRDEFLDRDRLRFGAAEGHTSGTSGAPLIWSYDWDSMRRNLAFRARQYRWAGFTGREISARFSGRLILGRREPPPFGRYNAAERQWLFSSYHMTSATLPEYYRELSALRPAYLDGYPSALSVLARWINTAAPRRTLRPWAVITTAEVLTAAQRTDIERAFGCRVYDQYSSSEGAPYVTQCSAGGRHINPESGIIEFLCDDGTPCAPGEFGHMVVTSFFQRTLPLVRYRIGDRGAPSGRHCACGRHMPLVEAILGREDDVLLSSERGEVGSAGLSTALYKLGGRMRETQIEQLDLDKFVVRYVPHGSLLSDEERAIVFRELCARLGRGVHIEIAAVENIPRGPAGKTRLVIGLTREKRSRLRARLLLTHATSGD